jgi:hypothetical protein
MEMGGKARGLKDWSWRILGCDPAFAFALLAAQLWLGLLWFFYQGHGIARGIILGGLLLGLIALRFRPPAASTMERAGATTLTAVVRSLLIAAVLLDLGIMADSGTYSLRTGKIPMDEGQTSWRAARLLWRGENPYGSGVLVDLGAYQSRARQREAAGMGATLSGAKLRAAFARYDATLDAGTRRELLSAPAKPAGAAARELLVYGYKYGPVIVLVTALVAPFGVPATVLFLNGLACFALYGVNWRILSRIATPQLSLAGAAMLALLLDRHITRNYIDRSATDVWALLFGSLAVLACISRKPLAMAAAIALAVASKSLPGLLFAPLLLKFRSPIPALLFVGLTGAIYLPWLLWDPQGIWYNVFLWPFLMARDYTSWEFFAPPAAALAVQGVGACALAVLWLRYLLGRETRLFWTLAVSNLVVLLAAGVLRNGYVPWVSLWVVAAIVEAFRDRSLVFSRRAEAPVVASEREMQPARMAAAHNS